jgi:hypothetical protein
MSQAPSGPQRDMPPPPPNLPPAEGPSDYQTIADKVGGVPNLRAKDNLYQGIAILACALIGAVIGLVMGSWIGAGLGFVGGMVVGLILSGTVLAVVGLVRKS